MTSYTRKRCHKEAVSEHGNDPQTVTRGANLRDVEETADKELVLQDCLSGTRYVLAQWHHNFYSKTRVLAQCTRILSKAGCFAMQVLNKMIHISHKPMMLLKERKLRRPLIIAALAQELKIFGLHPSSILLCWRYRSFS